MGVRGLNTRMRFNLSTRDPGAQAAQEVETHPIPFPHFENGIQKCLYVRDPLRLYDSPPSASIDMRRNSIDVCTVFFANLALTCCF
jgi:hypothetical protein